MCIRDRFTADLLHANFETHPGLDGAIVYEALLEPGDILHIPEGWGHQALNLEWSAMVSTNCVIRLIYREICSGDCRHKRFALQT